MAGGYDKINFTEELDENGNPKTPVSAENLDHMEGGIKNNSEDIEDLKDFSVEYDETLSSDITGIDSGTTTILSTDISAEKGDIIFVEARCRVRQLNQDSRSLEVRIATQVPTGSRVVSSRPVELDLAPDHRISYCFIAEETGEESIFLVATTLDGEGEVDAGQASLKVVKR